MGCIDGVVATALEGCWRAMPAWGEGRRGRIRPVGEQRGHCAPVSRRLAFVIFFITSAVSFAACVCVCVCDCGK